MSRLTVCTFLWRGEPADRRTTYGPEHVRELRRAVAENLSLPHDFVVLTDDVSQDFGEGVRAVEIPASVLAWPRRYPKLFLFSPLARQLIGDRFLCLDLDTVIVGDIAPLVARPEPFVIWRDPSPRNRYNTSMVLMDAGAHPEVWAQWDPEKSPALSARIGGSDQAWVSHVVRSAATWSDRDGVLSYKRHCQTRLPRGARIVFFHGRPKPWDVPGWPRDRWAGIEPLEPRRRRRERRPTPKPAPNTAPSDTRAREIVAQVTPHRPIRGAEIGVWEGALSRRLLRRLPDLHLTMVDSWAPREEQPLHYVRSGDRRAKLSRQEMSRAMGRARAGTAFAGHRRKILHMPSLEAAKTVPDGSLEFVFIDADHSYEGVRADIEAWAPKVRPGGVLGGHDYGPEVDAERGWGVTRAVDEFSTAHGLTVQPGEGSCWFIEMPGGAEAAAPASPLHRPGNAPALIIGGAECVWDDLRRVEEMVGGDWPGIVIAVNDVGIHYPGRIDHWATLHAEKLDGWQRDRIHRGHGRTWTTWSRPKSTRRGVDRIVTGWTRGASGMLAVGVALDELGCDRVVLAGIPMDAQPHFRESTVHVAGRPWHAGGSHWNAWKKDEMAERLGGRVRSMSGKTRELLGAPDIEWLGLVPVEESSPGAGEITEESTDEGAAA